MTSGPQLKAASNPRDPRSSRNSRLRRWLAVSVLALGVMLLTGWAALALYFAGNGLGWWRLPAAIGFIAFTAWSFFGWKNRTAYWTWAALFVCVALWFISIQPSHDREWRREVAVLPRIKIESERATISSFRDFAYRTREDFDSRYEERIVDLTHLTGVDLFISYWDDQLMAHTFLSFLFDNAPPVCVSIEARFETGERFEALPSIFKRFELIYVVGDERDIVRVRTNHRDEQLYCYPIKISPEAARRLFVVYAQQINRLGERPEFYHLLQNSCTANIIRNAEAAGYKTPPFDGRFILNGLVDQYLYEAGLVETNVAFDVLRARARITDLAKSATLENFSTAIRSNASSK